VIIQSFLTLSGLVFVFYGLGQFQHSRLAGYAIIASAILGIWFIWHPGDSSHLANLLGIGRGADLLLYLWFIISASLILVLHIKLGYQERQITNLARYIAISEANHSLNANDRE
jgi:hypothetical protein